MAKCIRYSLAVLGVGFFLIGRLEELFHLAFWGVFLLMCSNLIFGFEKLKSRIFFLFFHLTIFLFLMGRPLVLMLRGEEWVRFSEEATWFAITALLATLLSLLAGALWAERRMKKREKREVAPYYLRESESERTFLKNMQNIALLLCLTAIGCSLLVGADMLLYMRGRSYLEYYTTYSPRVPYVIQAVANMDVYCLAFFLAAMPPKRKAFVPLGLYLLSAVPSLLIGQRNPVVLNGIFLFLYYYIRDVLKPVDGPVPPKKKSQVQKSLVQKSLVQRLERLHLPRWLGRLERGALAVMIPVVVLFLSAFNYLRMGDQLENSSVAGLMGDFLYQQGVSFDVLCIGYESTPLLPSGFHNYTFGSFIDYFTHGAPARLLFGARALESGNTVDMALNSNSYTHAMSYVSRGQEYLDGHGWGSSYLLETYTDYGWIGIVLFSLAIGFVLVYAFVWLSQNWLGASMVLASLTSIFFIPRAAAMEWLSFVLTAQFLLPLAFCWFAAKLTVKRTRLPRLFSSGRCTAGEKLLP